MPGVADPIPHAPAPTAAAPSRAKLLPLQLTPVVLLIHGYHPWANDAGIYTAGIRHILNPALYPLNAVFVTTFVHHSVFPWIVTALVRTTHLSLAWILLLLHLATIWLFLESCRSVAARVFADPSAQTCAPVLAAAAFTLPVAATALSVMDPYLTARSFSTPLSLFAIAACLDRAGLRTALLLLAAILFHPLMGAWAAAFVLLLALTQRGSVRAAASVACLAILAAGIAFAATRNRPAALVYQEAVDLPAHSFLFLARWHWYEILGLVLPLALFAAAAAAAPRRSSIRALCLAAILLGLAATLIAAFFVPPHGRLLLVPLQPLRAFHILYAVGIILCGGVLRALFQHSRLAASALVAVLFAAMFLAQCAAWPGSSFLEWPGRPPRNPWQQAFLWIRSNTLPTAVFAFDPQLVYQPGEDEQGFRTLSERDALADDKDSGVVVVAPQLADRWAVQRNATVGINNLSDAQRRAALAPFGATWLLLPSTAPTALPCPFANAAVKVCQMK